MRRQARDDSAAHDPDENEVVALRPHGEAHAVAWLQPKLGELLGRDADGHRLHGTHAEAGDGFVTDEQEVGGGSGDDLTLDFIGGRPEDGAPQAGRERRDQDDEEDDQQPARAGW